MQCTTCQEDKEIDQFRWKDGTHTKRETRCRECLRIYNRRYYKEKDRERQIQRARKSNGKSIKRNKEYVWSLNLRCTKCGDDRLYVLDFHHVNPTEKESSISKLVTGGYELERIKNEIDKCIVLCSNCHREHHWLEKQNASAYGLGLGASNAE